MNSVDHAPNPVIDLSPSIVDLSTLPGTSCPCGTARRAFMGVQALPASIHLTQITQNAKRHYHKKQTEVYVVLECDNDAAIELDGKRHPVKPLTAIHIPPGVRHRALGEMKVLIYCTPKFDERDEFLDESD